MFSNFFNLFLNETQGESLKRQSGVRSDETTKTNSKYESDIEALKQRYGDYQGLVSYLKNHYGIILTIKSQKSK